MASLGRTTRRQGGALRPFLALFGVAVLLLLARNADPIRATSSFATSVLIPVERVVADAGTTADRFAGALSEIERLRTDNRALRGEVDRLTLENVRLGEQLAQAKREDRLAQTRASVDTVSVVAPVIARDPTGVLHTLVLGGGQDLGIALNDVVLSDTGLVGRVSEVGANYSKVLLITDSASTISALVQGSRATGIVRGEYGDTLVMDWILQTETVRPGDTVVTAGLGLGGELRSLYPKGLLIGHVADVTKAEVSAYQRAVVVPAVDLRKLESVLVVRTAP